MALALPNFLLVCPLLISVWHDDTTHITANQYRLKTQR
jgi:hypothetical protein